MYKPNHCNSNKIRLKSVDILFYIIIIRLKINIKCEVLWKFFLVPFISLAL